MAERGADPRNATPYLWEIAWSRGWELPPPPFMSAFGLVLFALVAFPALALSIWLLSLLRSPGGRIPFVFAGWVAVAAGLFGAVATPLYFRRMAKRYGLKKWSTFVGVPQRT